MGKRRIKQSNSAVSEVLDTVLLLGIAIALFSVVSIIVLSYPFQPSIPSANIIGFVDGNNIILEHHGGEDLGLDTKIIVTINNSDGYILTANDRYILGNESKKNNYWNLGENIIINATKDLPNIDLSVSKVDVTVVDMKTNSVIFMGALKESSPYTLAVNIVGSGTVGVSPVGPYYYGDTVQLAAIPAAGWHFVGWSGDLISSTNPASVTMNGNKVVTATFAINQYKITATTGAHGGISPSGAVSVNYGANQAFTITPNTGYDIQSVVVDSLSQGAISSYTFHNVVANHTISASFVIHVVSLSTKVDPISSPVISSPRTITATGDSGLSNVTLWYRWSKDNTSWNGGSWDWHNDSVDSAASNVDGSSDKGTETSFSNAQEVARDGDYMTIQEVDTGGTPAGHEWLNCNALGTTYPDWTRVGTTPYVNAQDQPTNYVYSRYNNNAQIGWFDFPSTTLTGTLTVNISIYCNNDDGNGNDGADVYVDYTGTGSGTNIGRVGQHTNWQYDVISLGTHTVSEVNNLRVYLRYIQGGTQANYVRVDHIRIGVSSPAVPNYQIDLEYQWTGAYFNSQSKTLCMYIGSHTGSETLNVNYRSGSSWTSLGTITAAGWNNFTATGLTSSTYTIQLIGATETSDIGQDTWTVDCMFLKTYNTSGGSNGHDWMIWSNIANPDTVSPWSWSFNFPNGKGYYEFYSIGKYGVNTEAAPAIADASCYYTPTEWLYVNGFTSSRTDWSTNGNSPYLGSIDGTNYIYTNGNGDDERWFTFADTTTTSGTLVVNLSIYVTTGDGNDDVNWYIDTTGDSTAEFSGTIANPTSGWYSTGTISGLDTVAEVNAARVWFEYVASSTANDISIDAARLGVHIT